MSSILEGAIVEEAEEAEDEEEGEEIEKDEHHHHHEDEDELKKMKASYDVEPDPECMSFVEQAKSKRFLCYMIVYVIVLAIIVLIIYSNMENFIFYSRDSTFTGKYSFFFGTVIALFLYTYATYIITTGHCKVYRRVAFWVWITFMISYIFWIVNLVIRTEFYVEGVVINSNGAFYLILATLAVCVSFIIAAANFSMSAIIILVVALWMMYLLYNWWFKTMPFNKIVPQSPCDKGKTFKYPVS